MKKMLAILLALTMVCSLGAVAFAEGDVEAADLSGLKVGVFWYNYGDTFMSTVRTALDADLDALAPLGLTYQDYDGNNNQTQQNEQIQTAISDEYNVLLVNMVTSGSPDVAEEIISMAGDIPVIFFNRSVEADGADAADSVLNKYDTIAFVGTDAPEAGHLQGKMIGEYLVENYDDVDLNGDGVISYAMMKGDEANVEAIYRTQYGVEDADAVLAENDKPALEYFDEKNDSKYQVDLTGGWSAQAATDYMNTNLSQYNEANGNMIELIICNNDNMAEGCITALEAAGFNDGKGTTIPVFGVDATDAAQQLIADGKMTGTVKQDAEGMADAIALLVGALGVNETLAAGAAEIAEMDEMYSVAEGYTNKLFVAYAPFTA